MILRKWQKSCIKVALEKYLAGSKHMMTLAAPGAGKTFMSARLADQMIKRDMIDLVLCFAPTHNVVENMRKTFSSVLGEKLEGGLGHVGNVYTYQGMLTIKDDIWALLDKFRVLIVLDEIHHCAGGENQSNTWGQVIVQKIQNRAKYTLALTGTPWRSDSMPVALANYCNINGKVQCDYIYGLSQAVIEGVCRKPCIELLNHSSIRSENGAETFRCFQDAMIEGQIPLGAFVTHPDIEKEILKRGVNKLSEYRRYHREAAGLVVASSVEHAKRLKYLLENDFHQTTVLVSYKEPDGAQSIDCFRRSDTDWIVSVAMVSEGTDVPRLRVTCMLSTVQTELFFRQLLGRTQRRIKGVKNSHGWLIALNTKNMDEFSDRLHQEVPEGTYIKNDISCGSKTKNTLVDGPISVKKSEITLKHNKHRLNLEDDGFESPNQSIERKHVSLNSDMHHLPRFNPEFVLIGQYSSRVKRLSLNYQS
ncbi:DEAD/DEAH box helicase family protein [Alteromonas sp. 1_MG-2023]|uniref:DEAD/DEAH box helicase n=1 Tax=Alteromonas sp. 1_MG-2023 TaxID=3062669 RepID=UPI0026E3825E|nr:DEAD/DEAH box helicase family protein [Alteromonas sp. 1_MG-2023]MDO6475552.1 DEAD/DEAH box helicase family protein [Alteromonas sp. 1_MG-2023]